MLQHQSHCQCQRSSISVPMLLPNTFSLHCHLSLCHITKFSGCSVNLFPVLLSLYFDYIAILLSFITSRPRTPNPVLFLIIFLPPMICFFSLSLFSVDKYDLVIPLLLHFFIQLFYISQISEIILYMRFFI